MGCCLVRACSQNVGKNGSYESTCTGTRRSQRRNESERRSSDMDCELARQLALEVEADLLALRLKKQLNLYRDGETIVGCQLVAGLLAFLMIGAFSREKPLAAAGIFVLYAMIGLVVLPALNRRNMRAWERMALPLLLPSASEDFDILDERTLRSRKPVHGGKAAPDRSGRLPENVRRANIEQLLVNGARTVCSASLRGRSAASVSLHESGRSPAPQTRSRRRLSRSSFGPRKHAQPVSSEPINVNTNGERRHARSAARSPGR
jgi:hypothetical protein